MKMPTGLVPAYDIYRALTKQLEKDENRPRKHGTGRKGQKKITKGPKGGAGPKAASAGARAAKPKVSPVSGPADKRKQRKATTNQKRQALGTKFQQRVQKLGDGNLAHHRHNQKTIEKYAKRYEEMRDNLEGEYDQKLAELEEKYQSRLERLAGQNRTRMERMIDWASQGKKIRMQDAPTKTKTKKSR